MGVVTLKSAVITNRDALPRVKSAGNIAGGDVKEFVGHVVSTSGDSIASKYIFGQIPSNARVSQLLLYCDDLGTTTIADFGLYDTTENGSAVVDADFFASAVSLKDGALNAVDITHEAANAYDISVGEDMIWQALGLSVDPCKMYDVVATLTAANNGTGDILLKVSYVQ